MTAVRSVTKIVDQDDYATVVGAANGIATLDSGGKLTPAQTPMIDLAHLGFDPETESEAGVAHAALQTQITAEATTRAAAITTEATARAAADTTEATARAAADALLIPLTQKGAASGVATLDGTSKLTTAQIPTAVPTFPRSGAVAGQAIDAFNGQALSVVSNSPSAITGVTYDASGNILTITEGGVASVFTYNADSTVHTELRLGVTRTFAYDAGGNLTGATVA